MEGGWKTPPPRVSSRAKSPGLIGLNNYPWTRLSVRIIGVIKTQFFPMVMYVFYNSNISKEIFAIDTLRAVICYLGNGRKHMLTILPTIWRPGLSRKDRKHRLGTRFSSCTAMAWSPSGSNDRKY